MKVLERAADAKQAAFVTLTEAENKKELEKEGGKYQVRVPPAANATWVGDSFDEAKAIFTDMAGRL